MSSKYLESMFGIINSLDSLTGKLTGWQEKMQTATKSFGKQFDTLAAENKYDKMTFESLLDGTLASPSGEDENFLACAISHLQQQDNQKKAQLTKLTFADLRASALIRAAEHSQRWDKVFRELATQVTQMMANVSLAIRSAMSDEEERRKDDERRQREGQGVPAKQPESSQPPPVTKKEAYKF